jgi:hypothetical protein
MLKEFKKIDENRDENALSRAPCYNVNSDCYGDHVTSAAPSLASWSESDCSSQRTAKSRPNGRNRVILSGERPDPGQLENGQILASRPGDGQILARWPESNRSGRGI